MFLKNKKNKIKKGSTLIEALALLTLFSIATMAFYKMYTESSVLIIEAKRRLVAVEVATEKIEQLRNVPYDELIDSNTVGGQINRDETITVNNINFRVVTHINFIDDPIDNSSGDLNTNDYKIARVYVLWGHALDSGVTETEAIGSNYEKHRIDLSSTFVPPSGFEGINQEYGILSINAVDSEGMPVAGATVDIFCDDCNTEAGSVDFTDSEITDANGNMTISVPPSYFGSQDTENYEITISKTGYQTTKTHEKYNGSTQLYEPLNTHLTVQRGRRTIETFVVDEVHSFPLQVKDPYCDDITGAHQIDYEGGRIVGSDPTKTPNETLYDLDDFFSNTRISVNAATGSGDVRTDTNLDGSIDSSDDASTGIYELKISDFESNNPNLTFWKMMPNDGHSRNKLSLEGALTPSPCNFIVMDETVDSLQIIVYDNTNPASPIPLENASVRVQNTTLGYVASEETDEFGRTYFPNDKNVPLTPAVYDVRISKSGYSTYNGTIDTTSGGLNGLTVNMIP